MSSIPDPAPNEDPVPGWTSRPIPPREMIEGETVRLEPLSAARHGDDLYAAFSEDDGRMWTYRMHGPFPDRAAFDAWLAEIEAQEDKIYFAYIDRASGKALGNGAFMAMVPAAGSMEVGFIGFSPAMQRTRMATEAMFLKIKLAFDLGYRRYEWTCDPFNAASMGAAERFGFRYEGIHRAAYVTKGRNRDKAIFAVIDKDWPALRAAYETWLSADNFDSEGQQHVSLRSLTAPLVKERGAVKVSALTNELGQPVDPVVEGWKTPPRPPNDPMVGRTCTVVRLDPEKHAVDLFEANSSAENWAYLPYGPFDTIEAYRNWLQTTCMCDDPLFHTVLVDGKAVGIASYLRINPGAGSIEVGHINYSPLLQRTAAATEAMHLMMARAFDLGYRRYEWKCNAANAASRGAAARLGFTFESVSRQMLVPKGHNRDTAWFSILDTEWPAICDAHERWLSPENFDGEGRQRASLGVLMPFD